MHMVYINPTYLKFSIMSLNDDDTDIEVYKHVGKLAGVAGAVVQYCQSSQVAAVSESVSTGLQGAHCLVHRETMVIPTRKISCSYSGGQGEEQA